MNDPLEMELGTAPPSGLRKLTAAQRKDLTDAVSDAKRRQRAALAEASERALGYIPRLLRGPVRKIFR